MKPVSRGVKERIISYINNGLPTFQIARKRYCVGHHCTMNKKEMLSKHNIPSAGERKLTATGEQKMIYCMTE